MFENDYTIYGKHASYLKFLAKKNSQATEDGGFTTAAIFKRYIDVYMNAALWGITYNKQAISDRSSDDRAHILASAFATERDNCVFIYRLVMLLDKSVSIDDQERINRAFRYDTDKDKKEAFEENMKVFNSYVRGGLELMYEKFTTGCSSRDDYFARAYEVLNEELKKQNASINDISPKNIIEEFL